MAEVVLIVDDDLDVAAAVEVNLQLEGYEVHLAHSGPEALEQARLLQPDLVLLDIVMPGLDGFDVCDRLRSDPRTANTAVILLTAKSVASDKLRGFSVGADDYVVKPFEPAELVARVRSVLRRATQMRDLSPLTRLPGNFRIAAELERLVARADPRFALLYADLNDFKSFNDHYGFLRGDEVIKFTARVLTEALARHPSDPAFAGHVGGDDFVLITAPRVAPAVCRDAVAAFDAGIGTLYDAVDAERGYIEVADRRGDAGLRRAPLLGIAIGVATTACREIRTQWEASVVSTEMKTAAKRLGRSGFVIDGEAS